MTADASNHPPKDLLIAFGQGKLAETELSQVEDHLGVCPQCCETLLDLKDDTFVGLVRLAKADHIQSEVIDESPTSLSATAADRDEPVVANAADDAARSATMLVPSGQPLGPDDLPAELAEHPRYRIVELIGCGGMGNVYRAEHRLMNRTVAIKVINSQLVRQSQAVERFRREVQAAAKLSHPNIVAAFDAEQAGDVHFLVMEFVEGTDLASIVKQRGPMSVAEACECVGQAAAGLQHAYEKGMVHRDIKPHNLMRAARGQVRILDFGLAGFAAEAGGWVDERDAATVPDGHAGSGSAVQSAAHLTTMGSVMGTPDYMAPEQAVDAHSADVRADIYSLGCTLHFLLTGKPPFDEGNVIEKLKAHAQEPPPSLTTLRRDVPPELARVVTRMLAKDPAARFQTPAEVVAALAPFAQVARQNISRIGKMVAAALLGITALLAGVIVVVTNRGRLEIHSPFDDVKVSVKQDGQQVELVDLKSGSQVRWLPSGDYELELIGRDTEVQLDKSSLRMTRLGQAIVTATWKPEVLSVVKGFKASDKPIAGDVVADDGGWKITTQAARSVPLFEVPNPNFDVGPFYYRAKLKTENVAGRAYLELWSRLPGGGEYFSKGLDRVISGTNGWAEYEIPFFLQKGQQPDLVKLNVTIEGAGTVWIKDIELRGKVLGQSAPTTTSNQLAAGLRSLGGAFSDLAQVTTYLNDPRNNRGGSVPVALLAHEGRVAFRFGKWFVVFDGIPCDPQTGILGFSNFNVPQPGTSGEGTVDFGAGNKLPGVLIKYKFFDDQNEVSINNHRFKLRGKATRLEFSDKVYDAANSVQTILVARDGSTRLPAAPASRDALTEVGRFAGHEGGAGHAIVSPGGKYGISCGSDKTIRVWDLATQEEKRVLKGHEGMVFGLAISTDGKLLASCDNAKSIRLWNLETGEQVTELLGHTGPVTDLAFMPDRTHLLSAGFDETLRLWNVADRKLVKTINVGTYVEKMLPLPDGRRVVLSGAHTRGWGPRIYDLEKGEKIDATPNGDSCMAVTSDGRMLLIGDITGVLRVTDTDKGNQIVQMKDPRADVARDAGARDAAITPDGRFAITTTREHHMYLWDLHGGKLLSSAEGDTIGTITLSPDGRFALTIGQGGISVWRLPENALEPIGAVPSVSDEARLQGKWIAVSGHARKQPLTAAELAQLSITFDGEGVEFVQPSGPPTPQAVTFTINSTRDPKQIDFVAPGKQEAMPGIYQFDGDRLKLALIDPDYSRPTNFEPDHRPDHLTVVLERVPVAAALGQEESKVLKAAEAYLAVADEGNFDKLYDMGSNLAKKKAPREQVVPLYQQIRDTAGKVEKRTLRRVRLIDEFLGLPPGRYAAVQYASDFEKHKGLWESVLLNVDDDGQWRPNTYAATFQPLPLPEPKKKSGPVASEKSQRPTSPIPPTAVPTGANLILDPSFENTGLTQLPRDWRAWLNDGQEFRCEVVAGGHTGQRCLLITGKGTRGVVFANDMKADRTKRYALKGWAKFEGDKSARAIIKFNYFRGSEFLGVHDLVGATADQPGWHLFEKTDALDAYPTADHFYAMCHVEGSGTGWFDDLELVAYDRDKLPKDFDARHGRHNRLHGPNSLQRWIGTWETEYAFRETDNSPQETKLAMTAISERTLGDYFLMSHATAKPPASEERLQFLLFDQNLGAFRQWLFSSNGKVFEWRGPWDNEKQTLELRMLPDASNLHSSEHFVDDDHIEAKLRFQYVMGQRDAGRWTAKRTAFDGKVHVPIAKAPASEPVELSQLNKFVGKWTIHATYKPSVWNPQPRGETISETSTWILGGRFLMTRAFNEKDELTSIWIATYEPLEKSHRAWVFLGNGSSSQWRITWDEASREFHWQAIDMPAGWSGTALNRWVNDDTFDNQSLIKDEQGRVLLDSAQEKQRKK